MYFVGTDLHKQTITMHVVDQARQSVASKRLDCCDTPGIVAWLLDFRPFQLVVEATASFEWFVQLIEPLAERVLLAHPAKLRVIAESTRKSDKSPRATRRGELDAKVLAEFLARDMIPQAHRPSPRQRQHRVLVRQRYYLRKRVTSVKNRIRRMLCNYNADLPDLFSQSTRRSGRLLCVMVSMVQHGQPYRLVARVGSGRASTDTPMSVSGPVAVSQ
jgi:transposase